MECKTARLFAAFAAELGPEEAEELACHLATCAECDTAARDERRLDAHLGKAMLDVPVPAGLRGRIDERLAEGRSAARRKAVLRWVRPLAAAAAVLLFAGLAGRLLMPKFEVEPGHAQISQNLQRPGDADDADAVLGRLGFAACAPRFVKYGNLDFIARGEVPGHPGRQVPILAFADGPRRATVYVLDTNRIEVDLKEFGGEGRGYTHKAAFKREDGSRWAYLILHAGGDWEEWLYEPPE